MSCTEQCQLMLQHDAGEQNKNVISLLAVTLLTGSYVSCIFLSGRNNQQHCWLAVSDILRNCYIH